jgi:ATP-dependent helicase/DNAse subunit B
MRLSKSGLFTYLKCPYAYFLQFEKGIRFEPSPEMLAGSEFHFQANTIFDKISLAELASQTHLYGIEKYIRSLLPEGSLYTNFSHIETVHYMTLNNKDEFIPIAREAKIVAEDAPDWCLDVGVIDRVDKVDGETILIEYKSGSFQQGINQELMMYKVLWEFVTHQKIDYVCAIYPKELYGSKLPSGVYFKRPKNESIARNKVATVKQAIRDQNWDKEQNACVWCGVADLCYSQDENIEVT